MKTGPFAVLAPAVFALALLIPARGTAQATQAETLDSLTAKATQAISQNAYESAVKILNQAKELFPKAPRVNLALGDLYYDKELYTLALGEYRAAESKGANDFSTLTQIARSYGKLNQEKDSITYLLKVLDAYPDSADTIDDLGWMYFKTHQLDKGEQLILKGIAGLGIRRGLAMTLGTIYSGMNKYDKSREYYLKSVDEALRVKDADFAAIAYYNLSLLEHGFFHYNSALRYTDESIAVEDRPSGHLARGELFESRMDFRQAEQEYQAAYGKDTTPLSKVNLANLYQTFGRLDLARRYAEEVLGSKDLSWLLYYGTDIARHFESVHELLADVYRGLARREARRPTTGIFDRLTALFNAGRDALLSWYHGQRFRLYALQVGTQYLDQGSNEDAWWEFYRGNEAYPDVALKYLFLTRDLETARTPHAAPFYLLEEGKVRRSAALLRQVGSQLDPFWEKEPEAEALLALIPLLKGKGQDDERRKAVERLYEINPGALVQAGIGLPLAVAFQGAAWTGRERALSLRFLRRTGSECVERGAPALRYSLRMTLDETGKAHWAVRDTSTGNVIREGNVSLSGRAIEKIARLIQAILEELYSVH